MGYHAYLCIRYHLGWKDFFLLPEEIIKKIIKSPFVDEWFYHKYYTYFYLDDVYHLYKAEYNLTCHLDTVAFLLFNKRELLRFQRKKREHYYYTISMNDIEILKQQLNQMSKAQKNALVFDIPNHPSYLKTLIFIFKKKIELKKSIRSIESIESIILSQKLEDLSLTQDSRLHRKNIEHYLLLMPSSHSELKEWGSFFDNCLADYLPILLNNQEYLLRFISKDEDFVVLLDSKGKIKKAEYKQNTSLKKIQIEKIQNNINKLIKKSNACVEKDI